MGVVIECYHAVVELSTAMARPLGVAVGSPVRLWPLFLEGGKAQSLLWV